MDGNDDDAPSPVAARCARLEKSQALAYRPSLSWAVVDAVFSFWHLKPSRRRDIAVHVPTFAVDSSAICRVSVDWDDFQTCLASEEAATGSFEDVHVAWALAGHAEAAFDRELLPKLKRNEPLTTDGVLTHSATIHRLLRLVDADHGEFYIAFLVLITVLEKALYDLFYDRHTTAESTGTKKNMILRDLLHSDGLCAALPPGMMALLKILFLPSGLNLRNLAWHGFVVPAEFPRCFACLTALLLLELPAYFTSGTRKEGDGTPPPVLFQCKSFDERFVLPADFREAVASVDLQTCLRLSRGGFVPRGREGLVRRAVRRLFTDGDELWFLFALLPVLEHAVRVQFVESNALHHGLSLGEFCVAQIDQYYSTLDGFGQRDKHQVLLHADVAGGDDDDDAAARRPRRMNALYTTMPRAAMAVCLDLFMMASGPNVRAKLCHGEADLSRLLAPSSSPDTGLRAASTATQLVLLAWLSLCQAYRGNDRSDATMSDVQNAKRPRLENELPPLVAFEDAVGSSFHPFFVLKRQSEACKTRLQAFEVQRTRWSRVRVIELGDDPSDRVSRLEFIEHSSVDGHTAETVVLTIVDKAQRIHEFDQFLSVTPSSATGVRAKPTAKKPANFAEYLGVLSDKMDDMQHQLRRHEDAMHCATKGETSPRSQWELSLLALSDADGLSVSACMMDTLASIERSLVSFEARIAALASLITDGTARTNQRRSLLNSVFFLPVFEKIQAFALELVVHQIRHMESIASRRSDRDGREPWCSKAREVEQLQRKLLQFVTAFEGCTGSAEGAQKSGEKALQLALQFLESKPLRVALAT